MGEAKRRLAVASARGEPLEPKSPRNVAMQMCPPEVFDGLTNAYHALPERPIADWSDALRGFLEQAVRQEMFVGFSLAPVIRVGRDGSPLLTCNGPVDPENSDFLVFDKFDGREWKRKRVLCRAAYT